MKLSLFFITSFLLFLNKNKSQNSCAPFDHQNQGQVKVIVYTKLNECFVVSDENNEFKSPLTSRFTFKMDYTVKKISVNIGDKVVSKKIYATNQNLSSLVFELIKNEKKEEYEIKAKLFENTVSEQSEITFQKQIQEQEEKKKKRDEEWELKSEEKKVAKEEEQKKVSDNKIFEGNIRNENVISKDSLYSTKLSNGANSSIKKEDAVNTEVKEGFPSTFQFLYNNKPITNKHFVFRIDDKDKKVVMEGTTNNEGICVMYTNFGMGTYDVELYIDNVGVPCKQTSYKLTLGNTSQRVLKYDYEKLITYLIDKTGKTKEILEKEYCLK